MNYDTNLWGSALKTTNATWAGSYHDIDITPLVKFGQDNELVLTTISRKEPWDIRIVRLDLFKDER